ncbi:MAG: TIGR01244 family sulfur transferase [Pseudomonadota bacterium]
MADFRTVTPSFSVAPQLGLEDIDRAADQGFKTILCNRPDNEDIRQPTIAELSERAETHGLTFLALPFAGAPALEIADQQGALIAHADAPVLAYCRSGTRSITAWALSQRGTGMREEILQQAWEAGYDLRGIAAAL